MMLNTLLEEALIQNKISIPVNLQHKLIAYLLMLSKWNQVYNLTSIIHPREMVYLHLIDSLSLAPYLKGTRCLDIGSGGGLPGIPLAILNPHQHWTLLDKNHKKVYFLTQAIAELGLENVRAVHDRCEEFHSQHCFDSIVARAYGSLNLFVTSSAHLLCPQGIFVAMKGKYPVNELHELPASFKVQETVALDIKGLKVERHIVLLQK